MRVIKSNQSTYYRVFEYYRNYKRHWNSTGLKNLLLRIRLGHVIYTLATISLDLINAASSFTLTTLQP